MNAIIIGLYGTFLIAVGLSGNMTNLTEEVKKDFPPFIPWLFALGVLAALNENEATSQVVKPFLLLLILNFILFNWATLENEVRSIYQMSTQP